MGSLSTLSHRHSLYLHFLKMANFTLSKISTQMQAVKIKNFSHIKPKVHYVAILHHIVLAL